MESIENSKGKWICSICTYENKEGKSRVCLMCRTKNVEKKSNDSKVICSICTFENMIGSIKCELCHSNIDIDEGRQPEEKNNDEVISLKLQSLSDEDPGVYFSPDMECDGEDFENNDEPKPNTASLSDDDLPKRNSAMKNEKSSSPLSDDFIDLCESSETGDDDESDSGSEDSEDNTIDNFIEDDDDCYSEDGTFSIADDDDDEEDEETDENEDDDLQSDIEDNSIVVEESSKRLKRNKSSVKCEREDEIEEVESNHDLDFASDIPNTFGKKGLFNESLEIPPQFPNLSQHFWSVKMLTKRSICTIDFNEFTLDKGATNPNNGLIITSKKRKSAVSDVDHMYEMKRRKRDQSRKKKSSSKSMMHKLQTMGKLVTAPSEKQLEKTAQNIEKKRQKLLSKGKKEPKTPRTKQKKEKKPKKVLSEAEKAEKKRKRQKKRQEKRLAANANAKKAAAVVNVPRTRQQTQRIAALAGYGGQAGGTGNQEPFDWIQPHNPPPVINQPRVRNPYTSSVSSTIAAGNPTTTQPAPTTDFIQNIPEMKIKAEVKQEKLPQVKAEGKTENFIDAIEAKESPLPIVKIEVKKESWLFKL